MAKFILKRLLQAIPLLFVISLIVFGLIQMAPFDVVDSLITPDMSPATIDALRARYGMDQSVVARYFNWLTNVLQGDFGRSLRTGVPISEELAIRIPNTMRLVVPAYFTALILAIALGMTAGATRNKWPDRIIDGVCSLGIATPSFWVGILLIYVFGLQLGWFPIFGMYTVGGPRDFADYFRHFVLPFTTLTLAFFPSLTRYIRMSTIMQVEEDYVTIQKTFQASKWEIFTRHISRNILIPIVTQIGMALPMLVTGAVITESIFSWQGVGPYLMHAARTMDYPVIMALMLLSAILVILGNLLSDVLYSVVDPRMRKGGEDS